MVAQLPGIVLLVIAALIVAVIEMLLLARHRRALEIDLDEAHVTIRGLRAQLEEATRPPAQFARMRLRRVAVERYVRLRLAAPLRSHQSPTAEHVSVRSP